MRYLLRSCSHFFNEISLKYDWWVNLPWLPSMYDERYFSMYEGRLLSLNTNLFWSFRWIWYDMQYMNNTTVRHLFAVIFLALPVLQECINGMNCKRTGLYIINLIFIIIIEIQYTFDSMLLLNNFRKSFTDLK